MSDVERIRNHPRNQLILPTFFVMLGLWAAGIAVWLVTDDPLLLIFFAYVGLFVGVGIGGYIALPDRQRPLARRMAMVMLGSLLLVLAFVTDHGNMQPEGFFFALLAGIGPFILLHYLIAKIVGPLLFGRIWCGRACWFGMVFEMLPYPYSRYRKPGAPEWPRYAFLAASLLLVAALVYGIGYTGGAVGRTGVTWFLGGMAIYYITGISMALVLQDNRAFCKYLCPIAVPLKLSSRFSLLKIRGTTAENCDTCEACVEMCPMNIRVKDYVLAEERVLSTECTLCQTCISICPHDVLVLSLGADVGGKEIYDFEPEVRRPA
ncbi:MAG: 4Fe-4S binding protein [Anaerolineae bacterium]